MYTLTTAANPAQGGSVSGGGTYPAGTVVNVTANPSQGWQFDNWSGVCTGTANPTSVTMDANKACTANFSEVVVMYNLTTAANPAQGGSVSGGGTYPAGTVVNVTANPSQGWQFDNWSGDCPGNAHPTSVTMDANKACTANFSQIMYNLTTAANPAQGGSVSGGGTYPAGTVVNLTANPSQGWQFDNWSGDCTGTANPTSVTMDANKACTANFSQIMYTLTTAANPAQGGSVSGGGPYPAGTVVNVTANPSQGWQFDNWSGDCTGTANPTSVTMDANKACTANFSQIMYNLTTAANPAQGGSVSGGGTYPAGTVVNVTANPSQGWQFDNWSGDCTGTANPTSVTMDANKACTANFSQIMYNLTTAANPAQGGSVSGGGTYPAGTVGNVTANPSQGWQFDNWSGDCTGTANPTSVTMDANKACTANFSQIMYNLTTAANPAQGGSVSGGGTYPAGTVVNVTANPSQGWQFDNWSSDCTGTANPTSVTMDANKACTANFSQIMYNLTTAANPARGGSVSGGGTYPAGTVVNVTANPSQGWQFDNWSGDCTGTANPTSVTMDANKACTANFSQIMYTLTTAANPAQGGSVSGGGTYPAGTVVIFTATPSPGFQSDTRSGARPGTANPTSVTMDAN